MNKKLIALAVAGAIAAPLAAQAQSSNVTIYGTIRMGVESTKATGATAGSAADHIRRTRVVDNASNLGFKGVEDLGNGLKAFWQIESALVPDGQNDTGVAAAPGWATRNSAIGLRGNFGEIMMGRWDVYYTNDIIAQLGVVKSLSSSWALGATFSSINGLFYGGGRMPNVITYTTPNMSGFTARIQYSTGTATEVRSAAIGDPRVWALSLTYLNGPLFVNYSHLNNRDTGGRGESIRFDKLSGSYLFSGTTRLGLAWERGRINAAGGVAASRAQRSAWYLFLSHQMGKHGIMGTYARAGNTSGTLRSGRDTGASFFQLSYTYDFSKRTNAFVTYGRISNKRAAQYDFFINSAVQNFATGVNAGADPTSLSAGLVHNF
jgi:predicted porin